MALKNLGPVEIMRTGPAPHLRGFGIANDYSFSLGDLRTIAMDYNAFDRRVYGPNSAHGFTPPAIVSAEGEGRSVGYIDALFVDGNSLWATMRDMIPTFADQFDRGFYQLSALHLWHPNAGENCTPGRWEVNYVAFLSTVGRPQMELVR